MLDVPNFIGELQPEHDFVSWWLDKECDGKKPDAKWVKSAQEDGD